MGGWTYAPWRGLFYPADLAQKHEQAYAVTQVPTIEVNATFYRTQKLKTFARWAELAPAGFVYALKAPRYVVGRRRLDAGGDGIARFMASGIDELGAHLGPILWQLPAGKAFDAEELAGFLELLPARIGDLRLRHAIELRDPGFACREALDLCREAGVAIVVGDSEDYPQIADLSADFVYARLQRGDDAIETGYSAAALERWAETARGWAAGERPEGLRYIERSAQGAQAMPRDVFVYFIREGKQRAPHAALALLDAVAGD